MTHWIRRLAQHFESVRRRTPGAPLALVFDIDGTILDVAPAARALLRSHAAAGGRDYLATAHETDLAAADWTAIAAGAGLRGAARDEAAAALRRAWSRPDAVLAAHRPFRGVLEVIRWFQLQPNTVVALNTGRLESQRLETLRQLNTLGGEYRVQFPSELLCMRQCRTEAVATAKVRGIETLRTRGYHIVAAVDNEPAYLQAIAAAGPERELLTFDSRDLHDTRRQTVPYDLRELLGSRRLPRHVQFVWQDIDGEVELQRFLMSSIHWGEVALAGFRDGEPILGGGLSLTRVLPAMLQRARGCKINLATPAQVKTLIPWLRSRDYPAGALWFHVPAGPDQGEALRQLAESLPGSTRQAPVDGLIRPLDGRPDQAAIDALLRCGATRFGLDWCASGKPAILDAMERHGLELHLHSIPDLESFLRASLLLPHSLGTGFDFPRLARTTHRRRAG